MRFFALFVQSCTIRFNRKYVRVNFCSFFNVQSAYPEIILVQLVFAGDVTLCFSAVIEISMHLIDFSFKMNIYYNSNALSTLTTALLAIKLTVQKKKCSKASHKKRERTQKTEYTTKAINWIVYLTSHIWSEHKLCSCSWYTRFLNGLVRNDARTSCWNWKWKRAKKRT